MEEEGEGAGEDVVVGAGAEVVDPVLGCGFEEVVHVVGGYGVG